MPFITWSATEGVDETTRKLIRSHVRRGKKQKKTSARGHVTSMAAKSSPRGPEVTLSSVISLYTAMQPGRVGATLYFVDFPNEIEPAMLMKMAQVSMAAMNIIFPLLTRLGYHSDDKGLLYPPSRDVLAWHINAFAVQSFIDRVLEGRPAEAVNPVATLHHQKGLSLLRQRLDEHDPHLKISDDTVSAVVKLATAAQFDGDAELAKQHMRGLRKMVDLRGGLSVFENNIRLLVEILRCDLSVALFAVTMPTFYRPIDGKLPCYPEQLKSNFGHKIVHSGDLPFVQALNVDLANVWRATKKFCLLANLATQSNALLQANTIYGTMMAVMYRLLCMKYLDGSIDETVRLGLLAFTNHIFLQWKDLRLPQHGFSDHYREYLVGHLLEDVVPSDVMLWLLMTGAASVFDVMTEPWLHERLWKQMEQCEIKTWKNVQEALKTCMWIPLLDDERGRKTYECLVAGPPLDQ